MKKLKKFFGVFAVALLLMSMSSNTTIVKEDDCWEHATYIADFHLTNGNMNEEQAFDHWVLIYESCQDSGFN